MVCLGAVSSGHYQRQKRFTSCNIPYPNGFVEPSGYEKVRIRIIIYAEYKIRMPIQGFDFTTLNEVILGKD
jgi:hypothetical protein